MKLFRIEHGVKHHGMWYNEQGEFDPFIMTLKDGKSKDLDMTWHERYNLDERSWFSGCASKPLLQSWFSAQDAQEMLDKDYRLYELEVAEFAVEEFQVLYTVEGLLSRKELSLDGFWDINAPEVEIHSTRARN